MKYKLRILDSTIIIRIIDDLQNDIILRFYFDDITKNNFHPECYRKLLGKELLLDIVYKSCYISINKNTLRFIDTGLLDVPNKSVEKALNTIINTISINVDIAETFKIRDVVYNELLKL